MKKLLFALALTYFFLGCESAEEEKAKNEKKEQIIRSRQSLPADLFSSLTNLETITIFDNDMSDIPADLFSGLINLQTIKIFGNDQLRNIPGGLFSGLRNLQTIDLSLNDLINIPADLFSDLINLQTIDLTSNRFSAAEEDRIREEVQALPQSVEIFSTF